MVYEYICVVHVYSLFHLSIDSILNLNVHLFLSEL